jgi:hypothetical protein
MAGSITYRQYTADDGTAYSIKIDKSNANAAIGLTSPVLMPQKTANVPDLPKGLTPRYILCSLDSNPSVKRKFKVGNISQVLAIYTVGNKVISAVYPLSFSDSGVGEPWTITAYRGEQRNIVPAFNAIDTGIADGDGQP